MLVINNDTLVQGPYDDLLMFAANRKVADYITRNYALRMNQKTKIIRSLEEELDFTRMSRDAAVATCQERLDEIGRLKKDLDTCNEKKASQRTWATIGKGTGIVVGVGAAFGLATLLKQSIAD